MRVKKAIGTTRVIAIAVVIVIIALAGYYVGTNNVQKTTSSSSSTSTPTSASTSTMASTSFSATSSTSSHSSSTPSSIVVEEQDKPDSMDPAVSFVTPGWEVIDQVYQGLVAPDRTSITAYIGVLALNWTVSPSGLNYTFNLRQGVTFSNGDPFNANDVWFSIYRTIIMDQSGAWILGQNLGLVHGNTNITDSILNSINYTNPSPENMTYMEYANQSVQVISPYVVQLNLGYGYNGQAPYYAFLATLTSVMAFSVDPNVVELNGGVTAEQPNDWMSTNALGTGFYELKQWIQGQSVTLDRNPNYWGYNVPSSELNYAIQPPKIETINIYDKTESAMIADLKSGFAQIVDLPTDQYSVVKQISGINVTELPIEFGSAAYSYSVYMDPSAFAPFQDLRVREAISYAIDYQSIIKTVIGPGLGQEWIGPVPPGFQFYNQSVSGLQPYSYDPAKAAQLLGEAGYKATYPNGTVSNSTGVQFPSVSFCYDSDSSLQSMTAQIIQTELQTLAISITLAPFTFVQWGNIVYDTNATGTSYPFGLFFWTEDFTNSIDYVSTYTQSGYVGAGGYYDPTVYNWTTIASTALDNNTVIQAYQNITKAMYNSYVDIWLFIPAFISVHQQDVTGFIPNPAGSGAGYFLFYNTVQYNS